MLKVIHQFLVVNYQWGLLKLVIHVLKHLRAVARLLHHPEVSQLLGGWRREKGLRRVVVEAHLRVITPVEPRIVLR